MLIDTSGHFTCPIEDLQEKLGFSNKANLDCSSLSMCGMWITPRDQVLKETRPEDLLRHTS